MTQCLMHCQSNVKVVKNIKIEQKHVQETGIQHRTCIHLYFQRCMVIFWFSSWKKVKNIDTKQSNKKNNTNSKSKRQDY